jgi:hypothetical protein
VKTGAEAEGERRPGDTGEPDGPLIPTHPLRNGSSSPSAIIANVSVLVEIATASNLEALRSVELTRGDGAPATFLRERPGTAETVDAISVRTVAGVAAKTACARAHRADAETVEEGNGELSGEITRFGADFRIMAAALNMMDVSVHARNASKSFSQILVELHCVAALICLLPVREWRRGDALSVGHTTKGGLKL